VTQLFFLSIRTEWNTKGSWGWSSAKGFHLSDSDNALSYLCGYTCVNDVTARDLQKADVQFTRAKGFDTFCPVGPHIEADLIPGDVPVECRVNGAVRQAGRTSLMIFSVEFIVRWISRMMTLDRAT